MSDLWHVEGGVKFHFSVTVKPAEMKGWSPARIRAFFEGIALASPEARATGEETA